jgi:hypothetical protein
MRLLMGGFVSDDRMLAQFHGRAEELVRAGLATAEMFDSLPPRAKQRIFVTEYGDRVSITRRARGIFWLNITNTDEVFGSPTDDCPWYERPWRRNGARAEATVAEILARFVRASHA